MARPADRDGEIFSADLIAEALRDSGYKNTAFALAELIDNSIQAKARSVEVICTEELKLVNERESRRLSEVAVIDNGHGMDEDVLRASLMFGNGTRLSDRSGMGRFGMGLPNASFSQARRVEVWSWQNGATNSLWTYIDNDEIKARTLRAVPKPKHKPLPKAWQKRLQHKLGDTGTLVVWSKLDEGRLTWRSARATLQNTEALIGRIYRRFIQDDRVTIRLAAYDEDNNSFESKARINDPMYLMSPSSTPAPFDTKPMFQKWGDEDEVFEIQVGRKKSKITVRFSYAREETIPQDGGDRGSTPYGRHAAKNIGVSLLRAGREIDLDPNWAIGYDPRERWWGCEVEFTPELDEMFGVTINKQAATQWAQIAQQDWSAFAEGNESSVAVIERLRSEGDPRGPLIQVAEYIRGQLKRIRDTLHHQTKGRRPPNQRHEGPTIEDRITGKFNERAKERPTSQDEQEFGDDEARKLKEDLVVDKKYTPNVAQQIVDTVWQRKLRLVYLVADLDGRAFFKVEQKPGGVAEVIVNRRHPFYTKLYTALAPEEEGTESRSLEERLQSSQEALQLMFAAWARYEQESTDRDRSRLDDVRQDWGRMASFFLEDGDE